MGVTRIAAVAAVTCLLIAPLANPATRSVALMQWRMQFGRPLGVVLASDARPGSDYERRERAAIWAAALRRPDDLDLQAGAVFLCGDLEVGLRTLRILSDRAPKRADLWAHLVRFQVLGTVRFRRDEPAPKASDRMGLMLDRTIQEGTMSEPDAEPQALVSFTGDALRGAILDRQNAFFQVMLACAMLERHRDHDATTVLGMVDDASTWDAGCAAELAARWRTIEAAFGDSTAISRFAQSQAVLFPHRTATTRLGTVVRDKAVAAEKAGRPGDGIRLRGMLLRAGSLMVTESSSYLDCVAGVRLTRSAITDCGGVPRHPSAGVATVAASSQRYCAYLCAHGAPDEAAWVERAFEAASRAREISHRGIGLDTGAPGPLACLWAAGLYLQASGLWMLLTTAIAKAVVRYRARRSTPSPGAPGSVGCGFRARAAAVTLAVGLAAVATACALAEWQGQTRPSAQMTAYVWTVGDDWPQGWEWLLVAPACSVLVWPLLTTTVYHLSRTIARRPWPKGTASALSAAGLPVALLLLASYLACVRATAAQEAVWLDRMEQIRVHEGRYYARRLGVEWPRRVEAPPLPAGSRADLR